MSLHEYYQLLKNHDWYYAFSDDMSKYNKGAVSFKKINKIMEESDAHKLLFFGFQDHYFSGIAWNTPKQPLPPEPADEKKSC